MINIDSLLQLGFLCTFTAFISGCTTSELASTGFSADTKLDGSFDKGSNPFVAAFQNACLSGPAMPDEISDLALSNGWQIAEDAHLEQANLMPLRKLVLTIPGGGGRFNEEQSIFSRPSPKGFDILNLERRYTSQKTIATKCDVYGSYDFLKSCEALGKLVKRAPDHNQAYQQNGAHFIRWNVVLNGKNAVVSCDKAPNSTSLPYEGIALSVRIDQAITRKFTSIKPASTTPEK